MLELNLSQIWGVWFYSQALPISGEKKKKAEKEKISEQHE